MKQIRVCSDCGELLYYNSHYDVKKNAKIRVKTGSIIYTDRDDELTI